MGASKFDTLTTTYKKFRGFKPTETTERKINVIIQ